MQDDPEPAPTGHTDSRGIDEDIDQRGQRQEEDPKQWQEPAALECAVHQRGPYPHAEQCQAGEKETDDTEDGYDGYFLLMANRCFVM